ncbi:hypothetical protein Ciccas_005748, partial [Cichlidogyrus casuarinus]
MAIEAHDNDKDAQLRFELINDPFFRIDPETGEVFVKAALDRDSSGSDQLIANIRVVEVEVDNPQRDEAQLFITLLDVNDNYPIIKLDSLEYSIEENQVGPTKGLIYADDLDDGENGTTTLQILGATLPNSRLNYTSNLGLVAHNGAWFLNVLKAFDREVTHEIEVLLQACDQPIDPALRLCTTDVLRLHIKDQNDNSPSWINPPNKDFHLNITTDRIPGDEIFTLQATDLDYGLNAKITYELIDPNKNTIFSVPDPKSGLLCIRDDITTSEILTGTSTLKLVASDQGNPRMKTETTLTVHINSHVSEAKFIQIVTGIVSCVALILLILCIMVIPFLVRRYRMNHKKPNAMVRCNGRDMTDRPSLYNASCNGAPIYYPSNPIYPEPSLMMPTGSQYCGSLRTMHNQTPVSISTHGQYGQLVRVPDEHSGGVIYCDQSTGPHYIIHQPDQQFRTDALEMKTFGYSRGNDQLFRTLVPTMDEISLVGPNPAVVSNVAVTNSQHLNQASSLTMREHDRDSADSGIRVNSDEDVQHCINGMTANQGPTYATVNTSHRTNGQAFIYDSSVDTGRRLHVYPMQPLLEQKKLSQCSYDYLTPRPNYEQLPPPPEMKMQVQENADSEANMQRLLMSLEQQHNNPQST